MDRRSRRTVSDLRRANRAVILQQLYFDGPTSRQALGPLTGLSSGSVSNVVGELAADGLVEEAGSLDSDGGRPRILLRVSPRSGNLIGIDVGETRVRVEVFDVTLTELARADIPLTGDGYDVAVIVEHIRSGIERVLAEAGVPADDLLGIGIGVPGVVERVPESGAVVHCQTIGWDAVPLEALLRASSQLPSAVPYFIDNGAKTLGQAEMWFGAGRGARSAAIVLFGTGVGACLFADGKGRALEWGHLTVQAGGRTCRCGAPGCLEAYAGAESVLERWREAGGQPPRHVDEETQLTALLAAACPTDGSDPDPVAYEVMAKTAEYLGAGLSDLINLFQPERILIGGWAGLQFGSRFLDDVRKHTTKYALSYPAGKATIALGKLGPDAVTVGAATLPLEDFFARGGRRDTPAQEPTPPAWRTALEGRVLG
ncbi:MULTISPECIES: ROK family transcriptional regulator [unclassified Streptomyces]|uniref:ROK family transcriptional regulator n=1 Tax=unclassified Streptomyces TaxID=2593676 RepID=UPI00225BCECF|nr:MULTISPECIES: ROK family transcriptional regulator [unclassified Streptomyces]MCX5434980.1 ROK family transcriptional regulator [Streptomyces sp. NBC_00063]WSE12826.1 ROK family transcriptional regulator [Streptomyces sp. NBC_01397]WUB98228.1 ROK family transcriptional regulator [Streptomyces sp. NBC_00569]